MMGRPAVLALVVLFLSPATRPGYAQERGEPPTTNQAAREAARGWLQHVHAGAWETAWTEAASSLRDAVTEEQWRTRGARARGTLGALRSRRLARVQPRDSLRQLADAGPFVLLRYHSEFETGLYVETVLVAKGEDAWRAAGYEVALVAASAPQRRGSSRKGTSN